jgi:hypothetical protein
MAISTAIGANLVAIATLVFALYFRRHVRRDLALSYVALNAGVMAVTALLAGAGAGMGLGLGLFGVLSIIRLRSDAITQEEIAYYFISLTLGLVNGLHPGATWTSPAISAGLVAVMWAADHPRFAATTRHQIVILDRAYSRENELRAALAALLEADVRHLVVLKLDMVDDLTVVDVRFRILASETAAGRLHPIVTGTRGAA